QHQPVQDTLRALLFGLGAGPATSDRLGTEPGTGALPRRPGASDRRYHRASEPGQKTASHSDLRRSPPAAAFRPRATPAAVELRHGFLALSHSVAGGPAVAQANAFLADARSAQAASQHAVSPGRTH